jgi:predicted nucleic acid-binding Zn ribbon protein
MAMTERKSTFKQELAIVPGVAWVLAVLTFACVMFAVGLAGAHKHHQDMPFGAFVLLVGAAGFAAGCWVLMLGYVNADSSRRGMGRVLWTLVCMLVPNGLGFIIYFLVRKPLVQHCPQCGQAVSSDFRFCPRCNYGLAPSCPNCGRGIGRDYVFCPFCGKGVGVGVQAQPPIAPGAMQT